MSSVFSWTCEMWMALGSDPIVAGQIMEMVMEKLAVMAPYVDKKESMIRGGTIKVATNPPLAVSHKHSEVMQCLFVLYTCSIFGLDSPFLISNFKALYFRM